MNTAIQQNICLYIIAQHWKGGLEKNKVTKVLIYQSCLCQRLRKQERAKVC